MPSPIFVRASAAPVWTRCTASIAESANVPNAGSDASAMGRAGHKAMESILSGLAPDAVVIATSYGIELDMAREVIAAAEAMADSLETAAWPHLLEQPLRRAYGNAVLTGHADRISYDAATKTLAVEDWKFGWREVEEPDSNPQMLAYAVLAWNQSSELFPGSTVERLVIRVGYPRTKRWSDAAFFNAASIAALDEGFARLLADAANNLRDYRTGTHCQHCPAILSCPAIHKDVLPAVRQPDELARPLRDLPAEVAGHMVALAKIAEKWSDGIMAQARLLVDERGPLELPDGSALTKCTSTKRELQLKEPGVLDFLRESIGDEALMSYLSIPIGKVEDAAAARARGGKEKFGKGERAEWEAKWRADLKALDAVRHVPSIAYRIAAKKEPKK